MLFLMPGKFMRLYFCIDTNRINARQKCEDINLLERWHENGIIDVNMPEPATKELFAEKDKRRINKAVRSLHSYLMLIHLKKREGCIKLKVYCSQAAQKIKIKKMMWKLFLMLENIAGY